MLKPMDMELIFSVISWIAVIAAVLIFSVPFLITFLFVFLPWIGFTQFWNVDTKDIEKPIETIAERDGYDLSSIHCQISRTHNRPQW
jgi:hypothetical protein